MNLQDLGAIGEIVGGAAVIATLIYLSVQIRQANVATHRSMYAKAATDVSQFWLTLAQDPELHQRFLSMLRSPDESSEVARQSAYLVMDSYLSLLESYYLHNEQYGEKLSQQRWERVLVRLLDTPGGARYWQLRRSYFHADFAGYVDRIAADAG